MQLMYIIFLIKKPIRNYASQFDKSDQNTQNHTNENKTKLTSKEIWGLLVTLTATIPVNCINRKKIN